MKYFMIFVFAMLCLFGCGEAGIEITLHDLGAPPLAQGAVTAVPIEIQAQLWDDSEAYPAYYTRYIDAGGVAIVGSARVSDEIFMMAHDVVLEMTAKHPEIREKLSPEHGHYQILVNGRYEDVTDIPENVFSRPNPHCGVNRIMGNRMGTYCVSFYHDHPYPPGRSRENRNSGILNTFVHEFAHAIHHAIKGQPQWAVDWFGWDPALATLDPTFDDRLLTAYETALENRTWAGLYAETEYNEYWAEGVQWWYYHVTDSPFAKPSGPLFRTREAFAERDPLLVALLREWFYEGEFFGRY